MITITTDLRSRNSTARHPIPVDRQHRHADIICAAYGVTRAQLADKLCRTQAAISARREVAQALRLLDCTLEQIAEVIGMTHPSVVRMLGREGR